MNLLNFLEFFARFEKNFVWGKYIRKNSHQQGNCTPRLIIQATPLHTILFNLMYFTISITFSTLNYFKLNAYILFFKGINQTTH